MILIYNIFSFVIIFVFKFKKNTYTFLLTFCIKEEHLNCWPTSVQDTALETIASASSIPKPIIWLTSE